MRTFAHIFAFFLPLLAFVPDGYSLHHTNSRKCLIVTNQTSGTMYMRETATGGVNEIAVNGTLFSCSYYGSANPTIYYDFTNTDQTTWDLYAEFGCEVTHQNGHVYNHTYTITGSSSHWSIDGGVCTNSHE